MLVSVVVVLFFILVRDFDWVSSGEGANLELSLAAVLKELAYVLAVALVQILNLIRSFSLNLRMAFDNENGAPMRVAGASSPHARWWPATTSSGSWPAIPIA